MKDVTRYLKLSFLFSRSDRSICRRLLLDEGELPRSKQDEKIGL